MEGTRDEHPTFLALFLGGASEAEKAEMTAEESQAFIEKWGAWAAKHASSMLDGGTPLGSTTRVAASGASDGRNQIVTYAIVRAPSRDAAAEIFAEHPHLGLHEGNSIEIMKRLDLPTGE